MSTMCVSPYYLCNVKLTCSVTDTLIMVNAVHGASKVILFDKFHASSYSFSIVIMLQYCVLL